MLNFIEIGKRIKLRRKSMGLTQKQLADLVNLSEASISRYEHGKVEDATTQKLNEFAGALQVNTAWLLGLKEEHTFETRLKVIFKNTNDIPDEVLNKLLDLMEMNIDIIRGLINDK